MQFVLTLVGSALIAFPPDTVTTPIADPPPAVAGPVVAARFPVLAPTQDSVFRYSAAYYKRLDIHRTASYAILPLFAFQVAAGMQLYDKGAEAPDWARTGHPIGAIGIAALFATNGVTGVMNLWEGRKDPNRGKRPVIHGIMMLTAGAGFTATGFLASEAKRTDSGRDTHRAVALSSMAIATAAYLSMLEVFR
jgi:Na+/H+ antiporter NhaA